VAAGRKRLEFYRKFVVDQCGPVLLMFLMFSLHLFGATNEKIRGESKVDFDIVSGCFSFGIRE